MTKLDTDVDESAKNQVYEMYGVGEKVRWRFTAVTRKSATSGNDWVVCVPLNPNIPRQEMPKWVFLKKLDSQPTEEGEHAIRRVEGEA